MTLKNSLQLETEVRSKRCYWNLSIKYQAVTFATESVQDVSLYPSKHSLFSVK